MPNTLSVTTTQKSPLLVLAAQKAFEMVAVVVLEAHQPRAGEQGALQERMMGEAVGEHRHRARAISGLGQGGQRGEIGLIARGHDKGRLLVLGGGDAAPRAPRIPGFRRSPAARRRRPLHISWYMNRRLRSAPDAGSSRDNRCWRNPPPCAPVPQNAALRRERGRLQRRRSRFCPAGRRNKRDRLGVFAILRRILLRH